MHASTNNTFIQPNMDSMSPTDMRNDMSYGPMAYSPARPASFMESQNRGFKSEELKDTPVPYPGAKATEPDKLKANSLAEENNRLKHQLSLERENSSLRLENQSLRDRVSGGADNGHWNCGGGMGERFFNTMAGTKESKGSDRMPSRRAGLSDPSANIDGDLTPMWNRGQASPSWLPRAERDMSKKADMSDDRGNATSNVGTKKRSMDDWSNIPQRVAADRKY
jgi:hypothetical protein